MAPNFPFLAFCLNPILDHASAITPAARYSLCHQEREMRDIPRWEEYELPDNPECWYDVYCDLRERVQRAVDEDAERLKMALDGIKTERAKHSAKFVTDRRDVHLPRERPTTKQRYASFDRKVGGIRPVFAGQKSALGSSDPSGTPLWSFERPQLPRETKKKNSIFTATKRNNVLAVPTKQLNNRASQVKQAPRSLLEEHIRPPPVPTSRRKEPVVAGTPSLRVPGRSRMQSGYKVLSLRPRYMKGKQGCAR
ncbi:hypothetical protein ATERTT37_007625 [Aspergillus terreus]